MSYKDLADRVCAASPEEFREIELLVQQAINPEYADIDAGLFAFLVKYGGHPKCLSDLNAAAAIVPEPGKWSITAGHDGDWQACVWLVDGLGLNWLTAPTPAQALTAAALLAREA